MPTINKKIFSVDFLAHTVKKFTKHVSGRYRPGTRKMKQVFAMNVSRKDVPTQMLSMAKRFDINEHDINEPNWRAAWIVERCNSCWAGEHCFKDRNGNPNKDPGFNPKRCPNYETYESIAIAKKISEKIQKNSKEW
jgi:hypothetical protein